MRLRRRVARETFTRHVAGCDQCDAYRADVAADLCADGEALRARVLDEDEAIRDGSAEEHAAYLESDR